MGNEISSSSAYSSSHHHHHHHHRREQNQSQQKKKKHSNSSSNTDENDEDEIEEDDDEMEVKKKKKHSRKKRSKAKKPAKKSSNSNANSSSLFDTICTHPISIFPSVASNYDTRSIATSTYSSDDDEEDDEEDDEVSSVESSSQLNDDVSSATSLQFSKPQPLASSFAKRCFFTKSGIGKTTQHYEGLTLTGNTVLMLASAMKLKGCPTICDEDLRRVECVYPNQFSRLPDELLLSSGWRRISKYCHFSFKPIPDGVPFFHSRERSCHGGFWFLICSAIGMIRPHEVQPMTKDTLCLLETDYGTVCDAAPPELIQDPSQWILVNRFCFFSGGPINTEEDVYYEANWDGNYIYMLAFLSPSLTPEDLYHLNEDVVLNEAEVKEVESVYDLTERDFDDLRLYHLGPCRALPQYVLQPGSWRKVLPRGFIRAREVALKRCFDNMERKESFVVDGRSTNVESYVAENYTDNYGENYAQNYPENYVENIPENYIESIPENYVENIPENYVENIPENYAENHSENYSDKYALQEESVPPPPYEESFYDPEAMVMETESVTPSTLHIASEPTPSAEEGIAATIVIPPQEDIAREVLEEGAFTSALNLQEQPVDEAIDSLMQMSSPAVSDSSNVIFFDEKNYYKVKEDIIEEEPGVISPSSDAPTSSSDGPISPSDGPISFSDGPISPPDVPFVEEEDPTISYVTSNEQTISFEDQPGKQPMFFKFPDTPTDLDGTQDEIDRPIPRKKNIDDDQSERHEIGYQNNEFHSNSHSQAGFESPYQKQEVTSTPHYEHQQDIAQFQHQPQELELSQTQKFPQPITPNSYSPSSQQKSYQHPPPSQHYIGQVQQNVTNTYMVAHPSIEEEEDIQLEYNVPSIDDSEYIYNDVPDVKVRTEYSDNDYASNDQMNSNYSRIDHMGSNYSSMDQMNYSSIDQMKSSISNEQLRSNCSNNENYSNYGEMNYANEMNNDHSDDQMNYHSDNDEKVVYYESFNKVSDVEKQGIDKGATHLTSNVESETNINNVNTNMNETVIQAKVTPTNLQTEAKSKEVSKPIKKRAPSTSSTLLTKPKPKQLPASSALRGAHELLKKSRRQQHRRQSPKSEPEPEHSSSSSASESKEDVPFKSRRALILQMAKNRVQQKKKEADVVVQNRVVKENIVELDLYNDLD